MGSTRTAEEVKPKSNHLRMSFAEWLFRMSEANLPYQAVSLAVFAVAFKVTSNEELAQLIHMDTKGVADKTYNKWKKRLSDDGFVIRRQITIGRKTTIEIDPSYKCTPVIFTDMIRRDPRKFYGSSPVAITDTPPVIITDEPSTNYEPPEEITDAGKESSPRTPLKENTLPLASKQSDAARELAGLNGSTEPMISDVMVWMTGGGDRQLATNWLTTFLRQYSEEIVRQAYFELKTDLANGRLIANKLRMWGLKAAGLKTNGKPTGGDKPSPFANFGKRYSGPEWQT